MLKMLQHGGTVLSVAFLLFYLIQSFNTTKTKRNECQYRNLIKFEGFFVKKLMVSYLQILRMSSLPQPSLFVCMLHL